MIERHSNDKRSLGHTDAFAVFEVDAATNSTLNPLFEPKPSLAGLSPTPTLTFTTSVATDDDTSPFKRKCMVPLMIFVFCVIVPMAFVWSQDSLSLRKHIVLSTWMLLAILIIFQKLVNKAFETRAAALSRLVATGGVAVLLAIQLVYIAHLKPLENEEAERKITEDRWKYGECGYLHDATFPRTVCPNFYQGDSTTILASGISFNGSQRLRFDSVEKLIGVVIPYYDSVAEVHPDPSQCNGYLNEIICSAMARPCNSKCNPAPFSKSRCIKLVSSPSCTSYIKQYIPSATTFLQNVVLFSGFPIIPTNAEQDSLAKETVIGTCKLIMESIVAFKNPSTFCDAIVSLNPPVEEGEVDRCFVMKGGSTKDDINSITNTLDFNVLVRCVWASLIVVLFLSFVVLHKPSLPSVPRRKYTSVDFYLLVATAIVTGGISVLNVFLCVKIADQDEAGTLYFIIISNVLGFCLACAWYVLSNNLIGLLRGKELVVEASVTSSPNCVQKIKRVKNYIDLRNGKYYYHYTIFTEVMEILLQIITFDTMVRNNDVLYVLFAVVIISMNLILTPITLFFSKQFPKQGRELTFIVDGVLELAYLTLNILYVKPENFTNVRNLPVAFSVVVPLVGTINKIDTLVDFLTTETQRTRSRNGCMVHRQQSRASELFASMKRRKVRDGLRETVSSRKLWEDFKNPKKRYRSVPVCTMFSIGVFFCVFMMTITLRTNADCARKLGVEVWEGAHPRHIFADGALISPQCHFETIISVDARGKNIQSIRAEVGMLRNLKALDLAENEIVQLPSSITRLTKLTKLDVSGNDVSKKLRWEHQQLKVFPAVITQFLTGLEELNLGFNRIESIPVSILRLSGLKRFSLRNNSISPDGVPPALIYLKSLHSGGGGFDLVNNPAMQAINWHQKVDPDAAMDFLQRYFQATMEKLNLAECESFTTTHVETIIQQFSQLSHLNASDNLVSHLRFNLSFASFHALKMIDLSGNRLRQGFVDPSFFYNIEPFLLRGGRLNCANMGTHHLQLDLRKISRHSVKNAKLPMTAVARYFEVNVISSVNVVGYNEPAEVFYLCRLNLEKIYIISMIDISIDLEGRNCLNNHMTGVSVMQLRANDLKASNATLATLESSVPALTVYGISQNQYDDDIGKIVNRLNVHKTTLSSVALYENELKGTMPPSVGELRELFVLDVDGNQLHGRIPPAITLLTKLQRLKLSGNSFQGSLPQNFGNLALLSSLSLCKNRFNGSLPNTFHQLSQLVNLDASYNQLEDTVESIVSLTNLETLYLNNNYFRGTVPKEISRLVRLKSLSLADNNFSGVLPPLGALTSLEYLDVSSNRLTIAIDSLELEKLTHLRCVWMSNNALVSPFDPRRLSHLEYAAITNDTIFFNNSKPVKLTVDGTTYMNDPSYKPCWLEKDRSKSGYLGKFHVSTAVECGQLCNNHPDGCRSFYVASDTRDGTNHGCFLYANCTIKTAHKYDVHRCETFGGRHRDKEMYFSLG